jgi:hypothetical protein
MLDEDDRPIDLMKELGRGAIYRGGEDKDAFLTGYAQGVIAWVILFAALWIVGYVVQQSR